MFNGLDVLFLGLDVLWDNLLLILLLFFFVFFDKIFFWECLLKEFVSCVCFGIGFELL